MEVFEEPKQVKKKTKKELTEEKKKELAERLIKAREILKQKKEAKKKETANVENKIIETPTPTPTPTPKPKKKKQVIIEQEVTSSEDESSSSEEEEIVVVKKKKERKEKKSDLNNDKLNDIFSAVNELVSYKKTKIEAKNNYLKYHEAKLKEKTQTQTTPAPAPVSTPTPTPEIKASQGVATPIEEPPEIILPSFKSLGNNRFNKRGF